MSPRPDRRAERIPQILRAAREVFARSGFAQARVEDIAQAAGLSKAAVYLYFPSKDEMIGALLQQYFADAFADLTALRGAPGPLRERLGGWAERRIAELEADAAYLGVGYEFFAVAARRPLPLWGSEHSFARDTGRQPIGRAVEVAAHKSEEVIDIGEGGGEPK